MSQQSQAGKPFAPPFNCINTITGRQFTSWAPRCCGTGEVSADRRHESSFDQRMYLTHNAKAIMEQNRMAAEQANACRPCYATTAVGTKLPERALTTCDRRTCWTVGANEQRCGLGTGRAAIQ